MGRSNRGAARRAHPPPRTSKPCDDLPTSTACAECGIQVDPPLMCSGCKDVAYCSRACQKQAWNQHKQTCTGAVAARQRKEAECQAEARVAKRIENDIRFERSAAESSNECPICLEVVHDRDNESLACGHRVHMSCWHEVKIANHSSSSANSCPVCRQWSGPSSSTDTLWLCRSPLELIWNCATYVYQAEYVDRTGDIEGAPVKKEIAWANKILKATQDSGRLKIAVDLMDETILKPLRFLCPQSVAQPPDRTMQLSNAKRDELAHNFLNILAAVIVGGGRSNPDYERLLPFIVRWIRTLGLEVRDTPQAILETKSDMIVCRLAS